MNRLSEHVAAALFEHITGALASNPRRLGKPLEEPYDGVWSTRRGEYRAFYTIDDDQHTISTRSASSPSITAATHTAVADRIYKKMIGRPYFGEEWLR